MKKRNFTEMSSVACSFPGCKKLLKARLVEDKPTVTTCYEHHKLSEASRGHMIDTTPRKKRIAAGMQVKQY